MEERKLCLWYTPITRNHKEVIPDFLWANMSVPCSQLLIGQSQGRGRFSSRKCRTPLCQSGGAPSWMNKTFSLSCYIWGSGHSLTMSRYVIPVTAFSWEKKKRPVHLCTGYSTKYINFWWIPHILHQFPWVFCSPYTHVVFVDFTITVEGWFVAEN